MTPAQRRARPELDVQALARWAALAGIWALLHLATDGVFTTPRNLYNLAVQTSAVAIMATGMVLVIVTRHIDLSVGSLLGLCGMTVAVLQAEVFPAGAAWSWPLALAATLALGAALGLCQGWWVAYRGLPAFVVTLSGLLVFRGAAYLLTDGRTVAPLEPGFQWLAGGVRGSLGAAWSWGLGAAAFAALVVLRLRRAADRRAHGIPPRPPWLEAGSVALAGLGIALFVAVMNAYDDPRTGLPRGVPVPVLLLIALAAVLAALARITRFGRYVFAIGGSPEAAQLAGIDIRRVTCGVFGIMGGLAAVAGALTAARLDAGTNSMGTLAELNVIAAAVIGGTSLAGGRGSVPGALLGALIMQSLENGLVLLGASSPLRQVAIGAVLLLAVWLDAAARRRRAGAPA